MAQDARVLRGGLAVRARRGAVLGGSTTMPQHGVGVARLLGVMRQPRTAHVDGRGLQRRQDRRVQVAPAPRRQPCSPRQAAPARDETRHSAGHGFEHAALDALLDAVRDRREGGVEQPQLGPGGHERDALQQTSRRRREPRDARQHRVTHRRRQRLGTRREQLGDKERVPAGERIDRVPVGRRARTRARAPPRGKAEEPSRARPRRPT